MLCTGLRPVLKRGALAGPCSATLDAGPWPERGTRTAQQGPEDDLGLKVLLSKGGCK